jgi:hypothetical protein
MCGSKKRTAERRSALARYRATSASRSASDGAEQPVRNNDQDLIADRMTMNIVSMRRCSSSRGDAAAFGVQSW